MIIIYADIDIMIMMYFSQCALSLVVSLFFGSPGPLLTLQGFHPSMLKWCCMHTLNLGLLFVANAAALKLACSYCRVHQLMLIDAVEFAGEKSKWFEKGTSSKHAIFPGVLYYLSGVLYIAYAAVQIILIETRLLLTEDLAYFGHGTFVEQLDEAYRAFTAFCKSKKIRHTQAPFTPKMVTWRCWKKTFLCMARMMHAYYTTIAIQNIMFFKYRTQRESRSCAPKNHNYPEVKKKNGENLFTAKAYNGRVVLLWLAQCMLHAVEMYPDNQIVVLTAVAMSFGFY